MQLLEMYDVRNAVGCRVTFNLTLFTWDFDHTTQAHAIAPNERYTGTIIVKEEYPSEGYYIADIQGGAGKWDNFEYKIRSIQQLKKMNVICETFG